MRVPGKKRVVCLIALVVSMGWCGGALAEDVVLFDGESQYHHVLVTQKENGYRYLSFDRRGLEQSAVRLNHPEDLLFKYTQTAFVSYAFLSQIPKQVLVVGLGGGSVPMFMRRFFPQTTIDIVEVDPVVVKVSGEFLGFKPDDRMKVETMDGRVFMRRTDKTYDLIFLDAYDSLTIPFHLTTREFLELVKARLNPGGIVAANISSPAINKFYYASIATYRDVFKEVHLFQAKGSGNYIFVSERDGRGFQREDLMPRAKAIMEQYRLPYDIVVKIRDNWESLPPDLKNAQVLTDDHAPVDLLKTQRPE